ncbi:hypothetical protein BD410DRAFT_791308 [Rickenella mellea]|uniref:Uncharacterized protein n=1 Tax=Rickenella mellea TaxID=50990 RepID=A0A4Y7PYN3_9AGAM|nr:hypothetical protein BD410DRAFT_791308 [Rickenella mellea]
MIKSARVLMLVSLFSTLGVFSAPLAFNSNTDALRRDVTESSIGIFPSILGGFRPKIPVGPGIAISPLLGPGLGQGVPPTVDATPSTSIVPEPTGLPLFGPGLGFGVPPDDAAPTENPDANAAGPDTDDV